MVEGRVERRVEGRVGRRLRSSSDYKSEVFLCSLADVVKKFQ